jgi:hypothetical protein
VIVVPGYLQIAYAATRRLRLGHTAWRIERGWHEHCGIRRFDRRYRGMPAQLVILTGDRTPLDYILGPLREGVMIAMRES